jgi:hypothetical protein
MSEFISKLETYADLEVSIIRTTKINKVLKAIIKLSSIPKDEDFNFKKRSHELLAKWNKILADDPNAGPSGDKEEAVTTNGVAKDEKHDGDDNEKSEPRATTEEAEKPAEGIRLGRQLKVRRRPSQKRMRSRQMSQKRLRMRSRQMSQIS